MIAAKTWKEIRATALLYVVLLEGLLAIAVLAWPSLREETEKLASLRFVLPADFMQRWLDGVMGPRPYQAYMSLQMFFKGANIVGIACACLYGTGIIARERENRTLELLLSRPMSRSRVLAAKFAVLCAAVVVPIFLTSWTALPLSALIGEHLSFGRVTLAAAYSSSFCMLFLALTTLFSVRLHTQVHVAFVVGAIIVFEVCIYFIPNVRVYSVFRLSDYDIYTPLLSGNAAIAEHRAWNGLWLLLASAVMYGLADRLLRRAEL